MNRTMKNDAENMLEIMERTADRCDIWQDRFVYAMAKAIWHILCHIERRER